MSNNYDLNQTVLYAIIAQYLRLTRSCMENKERLKLQIYCIENSSIFSQQL